MPFHCHDEMSLERPFLVRFYAQNSSAFTTSTFHVHQESYGGACSVEAIQFQTFDSYIEMQQALKAQNSALLQARLADNVLMIMT